MAKVLIVEDDDVIADELQTWLRRENYTVDISADGDDGLYRLQNYDYDIAIIDWNLPKMEGVEICSRIRTIKPLLPLLMLTSRKDLIDKIEGLDAGALDYLVKPCALAELSARLRALLRRTEETPERVARFSDLELNPVTRTVSFSGGELKLSRTEFDILLVLIDGCAQQQLDYKQIAKAIGKDNDSGIRDTIKQRINILRQRLKQVGSKVSIYFSREQGYFLVES